jgi:acetolactate synthase-1/2/3 large subunit
VVLQDEGLELIALKQDQSQLERRGVAMGPTRYAQVAEAFGGAGVEVSNVAELRAALAQARGRSCFSVIACRIEPRAYVGRI